MCRRANDHRVPGCCVGSVGFTIQTKSERLTSRSLVVGQNVRIGCRSGLFVVVSLDYERGVAELREQRTTPLFYPGIPFSDLNAIDESLSRMIEMFLGA